MRQMFYGAALCGLVALVGQGPAGADVKKAADKGESCGKFGTSVEFVGSPSEAAKQADKEEKLVFVLHVSGNFETPDFT